MTDVRMMLETRGGQMIEEVALLIVRWAVPRPLEKLAVLQNLRALVRGQSAPEVGHGKE